MSKIISNIDCDSTKQCCNNRCIFRLQHEFGLSILTCHIDLEAVFEKAGVNYIEFPRFEIKSAPASMKIDCESFMELTDE